MQISCLKSPNELILTKLVVWKFDLSFSESLPTATIDEFKGDDDETSNKAGSDEEITTSPSAQAISTSAPALPGAQSGIYAKAQEALRAHYQHMGLVMLRVFASLEFSLKLHEKW